MAEKEDQVAPDEENDQQKGQTNIVQGGAEPAKVAEVSSDVEDTNQPDAVEGNAVDAKKKKKRKSKKKKTSDQEAGPEESGPTSQDKVDLLLKANPQLESQFAGQNKAKIEELLRKLSVNEMLTGMSVTGKNQKDMASYKFWKTQPVPKFDEKPKGKEGPINPIDPAQTPKEPIQLIPGFEWVVMDMTDENELSDVYELLLGHYVEDDQAMFRFKYSASFLGWALKVPGWHKDWHVGIRATQSRKLVAFISGVPVQLRVRDTVMNGSEINFLCVHKKLRAKRLAPVLIQEITRRCHLVGVQQAIYTAGVVLPRPITTCRYFHRSIDWMKLYEIGFSPLPTGSNPKRQVTKNHIPSTTSVQGMRPMQGKDVEAVHDLLSRYLKRFTLAPVFSKEDIDHLLLHKEKTSPEQVIWTYVVEQPKSHKITDFVSFYCLDSQVIKKKKHDSIHAAYLYYYASAVAFEGTGKDKANKEALKIRLNELIGDALVHAKKLGFDVMNALTLLDNPKFLEQQKFGRGDGQLHYYLYNYRIAPMAGGLNDKGKLDEKRDGELGIVMLATLKGAMRAQRAVGARLRGGYSFLSSSKGNRLLYSRTLRPVPTNPDLRSSPLHIGARRQWESRRYQSGAAAAVLEAAAEPETLAQETIIENLDPKEAARLARVRNIGIAAHIDSGKTTATERVLYYTGRIKSIHEVRGKDAVGAKMDSMDLEREKGITIQSAATFCDWVKVENGKEEKYHINLIDTPGHIDFTIEVERALRVLDGAVMILCAVSGVQSQTITVDRQMRRYNVPRISFINKMDRMGANPFKAVDQINHKLRIPAAAVQVPIGSEDEFQGVVDLVRMKAIYNEGEKGETIVENDEIPEAVKDLAVERRRILVETLADVDEEIAEVFLDEREPTNEQIKAAIRRATISLKFTPVFMGSALADKSVQPMLDGVCDYLPNPSEVENMALDGRRNEAPVKLVSYNSLPFVGLAFKLEESNFGQLTYIRVYQGELKKGSYVYSARTNKKVKIPRIVRMHSNEMEEVPSIGAGEICAVFGVDCASGDTFTDGTMGYTMTSMFVPEPVVSLSIKPKRSADGANFSKAMSRFQREDPTFRVHVDEENSETIISGMGELHLDIYVERMRREYKVDCETGKPQVNYRETIQEHVPFDYLLKKQTGGAGDYARVVGYMEPTDSLEKNDFEQQIVGGTISEKFLFACEKGFHLSCEKGPLLGHKVLGTRMIINDGATHMTDSSEMAFKNATQQAFRETFRKASPSVLEPLMKITITAPNEFQGNIVGLLNKRNATINDTEIGVEDFTLYADCSLNAMFGFSSQLRAASQGKGEFGMEFSHYSPAPMHLQKELIAQHQKALADKHKK